MSMDDVWGREDNIDTDRLGSNTATERYQPHHGVGMARTAEQLDGQVGVISTIQRGPTGVGAVYSFTEPMPDGWHSYAAGGGPIPIVQRTAGA